MARMQDKYRNEVLPALLEQKGTKNPLAVARLQKIMVSMGLGKSITDKKVMEVAMKDLATITGQKPALCTARKSVSNFKVRSGMKTGVKVTLRGVRMYEFLDRLINVAIPRIRDFRGLNPRSFDGRGNYSMGVTEQTIFPEIDSASVEVAQGMNITFVTSVADDREAYELLKGLGMPFRKEKSQQDAA